MHKQSCPSGTNLRRRVPTHDDIYNRGSRVYRQPTRGCFAELRSCGCGFRQSLPRVIGKSKIGSGTPQLYVFLVHLENLDAYRVALAAVHARQPVSEIWHMAANSDIPAGVTDSSVDFRDTFQTTLNSLNVMKEFGIGVIAFASSSAIDGDHGSQALTEDVGRLFPITEL